MIKEINVNWYNEKRKLQLHFSFKHDVLIFSDVYWQKQISFICDLMVLGGCIPLFYGLTTVSRTKNECNDIHKKLKLSEKNILCRPWTVFLVTIKCILGASMWRFYIRNGNLMRICMLFTYFLHIQNKKIMRWKVLSYLENKR